MQDKNKNEQKRTDEEKRLAYNAYMRKYNSRRREEKKLALQQIIERKYKNEILGGNKYE